MWVPLVEYGEADSEGADFFIKQHINRLMARDPQIDTILLGCTHYPLLLEKIKRFTPEGVNIVAQGNIIAHSLRDYLLRHPDLERECSKGGTIEFLTTESSEKFAEAAATFLGRPVAATRISL